MCEFVGEVAVLGWLAGSVGECCEYSSVVCDADGADDDEWCVGVD